MSVILPSFVAIPCMAIATFEATEAAASVVFMTVA